MYTGSNSNNDLAIDLEQGARLTGNKLEFAKELILLLVKNLERDIHEIRQAYESNNLPQLKSFVHKLHGATQYCGTPRLRNALAEFETALKKNETGKFDSLFTALTLEATLLIQKASEIGA